MEKEEKEKGFFRRKEFFKDWLSFRDFFKNKELVRFFFRYQRKHLRLAIGIGGLILLDVLFTLPMPLVTRYLIDDVRLSRNFSTLHWLCAALLGVILLGQFFSYLLRYFTAKYNARVHLALETDLYYHVQELPLSYFSRRSSGYILSRISEVSSVEAIMADTFFSILKEVIRMVVVAVIILKLHFLLGLVSLAILPFFVVALKIFHPKIKEINKLLKEEKAEYTGRLEKNINAIEKIKSAVKEEKVGKRIYERLSSVLNLRIRAQLTGARASIAAAFVALSASFFVLWYGMSRVMVTEAAIDMGVAVPAGALTLGTFFAVNAYLGQLLGPARQLVNIGYTFSQAMAGLERVYEIFMEKEEDKSGESIDFIDEINFKNVDFSYDKKERVLKQLNLTIKKGERVAIVGESGQGKSTLIKMLMKFYLPDEGDVCFSGRNSRDIAVKSLRRKIAYISQRQRFLEEELEESVDNESVRFLLKKFRMDKAIGSEDIHQMEFSGGEVQKIELMEAIIRDADVLVVDEGTSNIDYNSERIVMEELLAAYKDKIVIFIAHRLNTISDFKRIMVIHDGQVVEDGNHQQLIKNNGQYSFLWGVQEVRPQRDLQVIAAGEGA